jgi:hypothetical protein
MRKPHAVSRKPKPQELIELAAEAQVWDQELSQESLAAFEAKLAQAEPVEIARPAKQPVSVQLDQQDLRLLKHFARHR